VYIYKKKKFFYMINSFVDLKRTSVIAREGGDVFYWSEGISLSVVIGCRIQLHIIFISSCAVSGHTLAC